MNQVRKRLDTLWRASRPLTAAGLLMLAALVASLGAMAVDHRQILGAPAWLKPAKFAASSAIYLLTVGWIFTFLPERRRLTAIVGWLTSLIITLEVGIIDVQAARGVTSHFNVGTPLDAALFGIMGTGIVIVWLAAIAMTVALFRQKFSDPAFGWALRIGMLITVIGQASGGFMTTPTAVQLEAARTTRMAVAGAHTVGAADGGPGLPVTGWSREHGDLRVPHFVGLHAVQCLPAVACLIGPLGSAVRRRRFVAAAAVAYVSLFGILLAQALAGQPLFAPGGSIAWALAAWTILCLAGVAIVTLIGRSTRSEGRFSMAVAE
jgi:hypothetical protein